MKKLYFLLVTILLIGNSSVHGQFQVVHDVGITPGATKTIVTSDQGMITVQRVDSTHLFRKYDAQGELLWNKVFQDTSALSTYNQWYDISTLTASNSGGCIFARFIGTISLPPLFPNEPADSVWSYINLMELDADGNIIMSSQIEKFQHFGGYLLGASSLELILQPDGSILLLANYDGSSSMEFIELYKMGSDGTLLWGRSIGRQSWPGAIPTVSYEMFPEARMTTDVQGNVYVTEREDVGISDLYLAKISPNGDLQWMNNYIYTNGDAMFDGLRVDSNGNIHGGGGLVSPVGDFAFFLIISPNGDLEKADIYRISYDLVSLLQKGDFGLDNEGRRYYKANYYETGVSGPVEKQLIVQADTTGSPALLLRRNDQVILPNNVFVPLQDMDVWNDRMAVSAVLNHQHVDLAATTRYETAILFETDDLFSCILTDSTLADIPVPLKLFTTIQPADAASIDISAYVDVYPMTAFTISDAATEPLEDLCTFAYNLLGIQIGIEEATVEGSALVNQTLIAAGSPLAIIHPEVTRIELYNASGQLLVEKIFANEDRSIVGTDRSTGIHLLRGFDRSGSQVAVQRIMIE